MYRFNFIITPNRSMSHSVANYPERRTCGNCHGLLNFASLVLILTLSLLIAASTPLSIEAQELEQRPSKSQEKKKKKKGRDSDDEGVRKMIPVPVEPAAPYLPSRPANGSLYTDEAAVGNLFIDFKAQRPGDLVFIDIVEESTATVASNARRSRDSGTLGGLVGAAGALPVGGVIAGEVIGGLGSRKFEGSGATSRNSSMTARVAARVVQVLPNGDLQIEAQKMVKINKEDEMMTLSGIVRRRDISASNAVPTTVIGDLRVAMNGKGVASADNAPGWLFRLFEKIAPF